MKDTKEIKTENGLSLTKAEELVMQLLWKKESAFVNELVEMFAEPKPAYNTVSTIVRILEKKGFVSYHAFGKTHQYYPLISQAEYLGSSLQKMSENYFENSYANFLSFFAEQGKLKAKDIAEIKEMIKKL